MTQAEEAGDLPSPWNFPHERRTFLTTTGFELELVMLMMAHRAYALVLMSSMVES
jgi:hypothetical protein